MNKINSLLIGVTIIQKEHKRIEEEKKEEKFNIFTVMSMEHNEVNTHSALIGELLNPNGSHEQGSKFLDLFVKQIKETFHYDNHIKELNKFGSLVNDSICERTINKDHILNNYSGGRIDIIVEDKKQMLIIENKLYAIDQPFQLIRYNNYAIAKNIDYHIILYLTLDGKELDKEEKFNEERGYHFKNTELNKYNVFKDVESNKNHCCLYYPISFKYEILKWIEKCLQVPELKPLLKATLQQYLALIKKITFQTMTEERKKEIVKHIIEEPSKADNVRSAFEIINSTRILQRKLYYDFIDKP